MAGAAAAMDRRRALVFSGPGTVELCEETCPQPGPGELLVRTRVSAVSAGTELLAYRGQLPADLALDETLPTLSGTCAFPFRYGYAAVGTVVETGAGVDGGWRGRRVFAFVPHASAFVVPVGEAFVVPDAIPDEIAPMLASAETAVNLVFDGRPLLRERVAVVGQGTIGLLLTAILAKYPLDQLVAVEPAGARAALARAVGASEVFADAGAAAMALGPSGADLCYEVSGNPAALDTAIKLTGAEGRVVVGSFYGNKRAPVDLGTHFHRGRLQIQSSQVSHIGPALRGRWDRQRRMTVAWQVLATPGLRSLVTHRVPFADAPAGYRLLAAGDPAALQVLFVYESEPK
jgi:2-desacetyl-2-hydroxyethyl bacteriochlorophyllide A dehydrogenase